MARESLITEALVLRSVAYRDADLIVTLYTREHGRLAGLARGARKSRRRFSGALGLFTLSSVQLGGRSGGEMWTLQGAEPVRSFASLALDMGAFAHASYATELVRELTAAEQPEALVLDLLLELYQALTDDGPSPPMLRAFELRLLHILGLAPVLDRCVGCGTGDVDGRGLVLDVARGGVCCVGCAALARQTGVRPLSGAARRGLAACQAASSLASARAEAPAPEVAAEVRDALLAIVLDHVGKPLRSLEFIAKMTGASRSYRNGSQRENS